MIDIFSILVTEKCNRSCKHCYGSFGPDPKKGREMPFNKVKDYIDQIPNHKTNTLVITGGEPFLYEEFDNIIKYADNVRDEKGYPRRIETSTNGYWAEKIKPTFNRLFDLKEEGLDFIRFSNEPYRPKKDQSTARVIGYFYELFSEEEELKSALPEVGTEPGYFINPIGRAKKLPKEKWFKRETEKGRQSCSLDGWAVHLYKQKNPDSDIKEIPKSVLASPDGMFLCNEVANVIKMGEYGDPISSVEKNVKKLDRIITLFCAYGPKKSYEFLRKEFTELNLPEAEHSCIACNQLFNETDRDKLIEINSEKERIKKIKENMK